MLARFDGPMVIPNERDYFGNPKLPELPAEILQDMVNVLLLGSAASLTFFSCSTYRRLVLHTGMLCGP